MISPLDTKQRKITFATSVTTPIHVNMYKCDLAFIVGLGRQNTHQKIQTNMVGRKTSMTVKYTTTCFMEIVSALKVTY